MENHKATKQEGEYSNFQHKQKNYLHETISKGEHIDYIPKDHENQIVSVASTEGEN
jgi:hypothetical protein